MLDDHGWVTQPSGASVFPSVKRAFTISVKCDGMVHMKHSVKASMFISSSGELGKQLARESELQGATFCSLPGNWHLAWQIPRSSSGLVCLPRESNRCLACLHLSQPQDSQAWFKASWSRLHAGCGQRSPKSSHLQASGLSRPATQCLRECSFPRGRGGTGAVTAQPSDAHQRRK